MRAFKIPQRLLGGGPVAPVRLDRIAEFGQGGLGRERQPRRIAAGFPGQQIGYRIGRWGGAIHRVRPPRRRKNRGGLRGRGVVFRARGLRREGRGRGRRGSGGRRLGRRYPEQGSGVTLALQEKRVHANADQSDR